MVERIIGRRDELALIGGFLEALPNGPRALLLEGEAGIGKTILWRRAVELAKERGYTVLTTRAAEAEARLSLSGLGDLLRSLPSDAIDGLPGPQSHALNVALLREEPERRLNPYAVALASFEALRAAATNGPLLLAVDDVQWLDPASGRVLGFVARRLSAEPIGLCLSGRPDLPASSDLGRALAELRLERLAVGPLTLGALFELLRLRLGVAYPRHVLVALRRQAQGNPFHALELVRHLRDHGLEPRAGEPLPVPHGVRDLVRGRFRRLTPGTRDVLFALAALERPNVHMLEATFGGEATSALARAEKAGFLAVDGDDVRFVHPLFASAVYAEAAGRRSRELHRRLAKVVEDLEQRARHRALAAAERSEAVASELEAAGRRADVRGAPDAAAELFELSVGATPSEAPDEIERRRLLAGLQHYRAGNSDRAVAVLEDALADAPSGAARATVLLALADVWADRAGEEAIVLLRRALAEKPTDDALRGRLSHRLSAALLPRAPEALREARRLARRALALGERAGDKAVIAEAIATLFDVETGRLVRKPVLAQLERGSLLEAQCGTVPLDFSPTLRLARYWNAIGDLDQARTGLEALARRAESAGDSSLWVVLFLRGNVEYFAGRLALAVAFLGEAMRIAEESGRTLALADCLALQALCFAFLGDEERTREASERGMALLTPHSRPHRGPRLALPLALLEQARNRPGAAEAILRPWIEEVSAAGWLGDPGWLTFFSLYVSIVCELGDAERAAALLEPFEARIHPTDVPNVRFHLERNRAQIAEASGDLEGALRAIDRARAVYDELPAAHPLLLARLLLDAGRVQRLAHAKQAARASLSEAVALFDATGARLWAEQARSELARIGGRAAPAHGALSETERLIAQLVAAGRTNRQVADALHLSPKTVAWNLSKIYRKLGVNSRTELAATLDAR